MPQIRLRLAGLSCEHCVRAVTQALEGLTGVRSAAVTLDPQEAVVVYDSDGVGIEQMRVAIEEEGYTVEA